MADPFELELAEKAIDHERRLRCIEAAVVLCGRDDNLRSVNGVLYAAKNFEKWVLSGELP